MAAAGNNQVGRSALALSRAGGVVRALSGPPGERGPAVWIVEIAFAILLAWLLGLLTAQIFKPIPEAQIVVPASGARAQLSPEDGALNPFRSVAAPMDVEPLQSIQDLAETSLDLVLYGTWVDDDGGSAIIGSADDDQKRYAVGDVIVSGVTLREVYPNQVTISRNGVNEALKIKNWRAPAERSSQVSSVRPRNASAGSTRGTTQTQGGGFTDIVRMSSKNVLGEGTQFVLSPAGDPAAFEAFGLEDGDLLISIDEFQIAGAPAAIGPAIRQLQGKSEATLVVNRDGVETPVLILLPGGNDSTDDKEAAYEN